MSCLDFVISCQLDRTALTFFCKFSWCQQDKKERKGKDKTIILFSVFFSRQRLHGLKRRDGLYIFIMY